MDDKFFKKLGEECVNNLKELNPTGGMRDFIRMAVEFGYKRAIKEGELAEDLEEEPVVKKRGFKKGDKVEIVGNIPFHLQKEPRPLLGKVTNVNGFYIMVKPHYKRWEAEFYPNELKHAT